MLLKNVLYIHQIHGKCFIFKITDFINEDYGAVDVLYSNQAHRISKEQWHFPTVLRRPVVTLEDYLEYSDAQSW